MRYPITFTIEADDFEDARRIARQFRNTLREHDRAFDPGNAKLLKLRDPNSEATEPDNVADRIDRPDA